MSPASEDPVAVYLEQFEAGLRRSWLARRRIVDEVRAHLEEGVELVGRERGLSRDAAARETVARFGCASQLASQFNALPSRCSAAVRRLAVLWVAWLAAMGMGSATVWASLDAPASAARSQHALVVPPTDARSCKSAAAPARVNLARSSAPGCP